MDCKLWQKANNATGLPTTHSAKTVKPLTLQHLINQNGWMLCDTNGKCILKGMASIEAT